MRKGLLAVTAVALALAAGVTESQAAVLYDNGPINGQSLGWTINSGLAVADSFTLSTAATVTGVNFGAWMYDTLLTVDWGITGVANTFPDQGTASVSNAYQYTNSYGYLIYWDSFSTTPTYLAAGTYWLVLQNGVGSNEDPAFWDQNYGPSTAYANTVGVIPSESFQVLGSAVPEPCTWAMMLLGFAGLGYAGYRKARRRSRSLNLGKRCRRRPLFCAAFSFPPTTLLAICPNPLS